jgi:hypothetical protein
MFFEGTHPNHHVKIIPTPLCSKLTPENMYSNPLELHELKGNCYYFKMSFIACYETFSKHIRPVYKLQLSTFRFCCATR